MAMPAQHTEWTVDMVRALPDDGNRYEVIDGELFVTPAPSWTHQRAGAGSSSRWCGSRAARPRRAGRAGPRLLGRYARSGIPTVPRAV